jgi:hypothetical protein
VAFPARSKLRNRSSVPPIALSVHVCFKAGARSGEVTKELFDK